METTSISHQRQEKSNPVTSPDEVATSPQTPSDNILHLQQSFGNQAVIQMMREGQLKQSNPTASAFNPNAFAIASTATKSPIQRRLRTTSADLSGKQGNKFLGKIVDNAALSTFRAIEKALDEYHKTGEDDGDAQSVLLRTIVEKCRSWLNDKSHVGTDDDTKRASLTQLEIDAKYEYRRVTITKELGIPRQMIVVFDHASVDQFWDIVLDFEKNDAKSALTKFDTVKDKLGEAAKLIGSLMKRNQIHKIDPGLAAAMNNPDFKMSSTDGGQAGINLIKAQAQEKIDRFQELKKQHDEATAKIIAEMAKPQDQRTLKQSDFPILTQEDPLNKEYNMLKAQQAQYTGIINGTTAKEKMKDKLFSKFSNSEMTGLMGYTSNLYGAINNPLRNDVGDNTKFTAGHRSLAGSITSALHKLPAYKGIVYKHSGDFPGYALVNVPGAIVSDMAPNSTAKNQKGPANAGENHEVLEIITSRTGRDVSKASVFGSGEEEVLFAPGTRYRILAAFERNRAYWGQNHDPNQWMVPGQPTNKYFQQAMAAVDVDTKKSQFHRVVIKEEV